MARPKEFDRDEALGSAMAVFWRSGYESTSTEALLAEMRIGRQSLYDTFGGKHELFVKALESYRERFSRELACRLGEAVSPVEAIRALFRSVGAGSDEEKRRGCMMVNAVVELAPRDPEIARIVAANQRALEETLRSALVRARALGELPAGADPARLARYLLASLQGLRVSAKANPDPVFLDDIADQMLKVLER